MDFLYELYSLSIACAHIFIFVLPLGFLPIKLRMYVIFNRVGVLIECGFFSRCEVSMFNISTGRAVDSCMFRPMCSSLTNGNFVLPISMSSFRIREMLLF